MTATTETARTECTPDCAGCFEQEQAEAREEREDYMAGFALEQDEEIR